MSKIRSLALHLCTAFVLCTVGTAHAGPIVGLYATGVDNSGNALGNGATDPHYVILGGSNAVTISNISFAWLPNSSSSRWIWQTADGTPTNVTLTFRTTFDLTGFDPSTASISGTWAADNYGDFIRINGVSIPGFSGPTYPYLTSFTISSGFIAGLNTLDFVVRDVGVIGGLRIASLSGTATAAVTAVPEPASIALAGMGLAGFMAILVRRKRSA